MNASGFADASDEDLAQRAPTNPSAFTVLYNRYAKRAFGLLATMRLDPHTADDVAQQAWLKAWNGLPTKPADSPFGPWLMQIVRNAALDQLRKKSTVPIPENAQFAAAGARDVLSDVEEASEMDRMRECIGKLPEVERQIFQGRLEGIDSPIIARSVGLTSERVHRLFHDAKHKVQRCLGVRP